MNNDIKYRYDSNYNAEANFTRIKFGYNSPILETELNEMQILQEKSRSSLTRRLVPSGFIETIQKEFTGSPIIYNPIINTMVNLNSVAIAPARAIINGYELVVEGNFSANGFNNYVLIDLGDAPEKEIREDLVYLEAWFEVLDGNENVKKYGYANGDYIGYSMIDPRVNEETSRRVVLRWNIQVAKNVNFSQYSDGFGYLNSNNFSPIRAIANGKLGNSSSLELVFANANNDIFKECEFYKDNNLWIAGRPYNNVFKSISLDINNNNKIELNALNGMNINGDTTPEVYNSNNQLIQGTWSGLNTSRATFVASQNINDKVLIKYYESNLRLPNIYGNYVFALPLFKVKRRSKELYSITNFNGALSYSFQDQDMNSSIINDLNNHIRPDKLFYDYIVPQDIIDLRRSISIKEFRSEYYLDRTIKELFNGKLQTKDTNQMRRIQFGNKELDYANDNIVFISRFNDTIASIIPGISNPTYRSDTNNFVYKDSVNGHGLLVDGKNSIKYDLKFVNNSQGTIDFYLQPYWHGSDDLSQSILAIYDMNDHLVFKFEKKYCKLIFSQYYDANGVVNTTEIDLTNSIMYAKNIYHIRLSWSSEEEINASFIYVNGKLLGQNSYMAGSLIPSYLKLGALETLPDNSGFVIENLIIYNKAFEKNVLNENGSSIKNEFWTNLPNDFIASDALLYPSFNSLTSNFSDNSYIQNNTVIGIDANNSTSFLLSIPEGKIISSNTNPVVYDLEGNIINGYWTGLDTNKATFQSAILIDKVIVIFSLQIPEGNGGYDLPNEILAAGLLLDDKIKEISFNRKDSIIPRKVNFYKPRRVNGMIDSAYDFSTNREDDQCYTRLLYYYVGGNGTNVYQIPMTLYGYDVIGILEVNNKKIVDCVRIPDTQNAENGIYEVTLSDRLLYGEVIEFQLALGGMTFDYETQSKTLITNIHKTKILKLVADGNNDEFVLPCFTDGKPCDGILKSVFTYNENVLDANKKVVGKISHRTYFINNSMFIPVLPEDPRQPVTYKLATYQIKTEVDSFGTPFLRVKFDDRPKAGDVIEIPVLVSYQPSENEVISIWYNHIPYQGTLSNQPRKLKRISNWKYFLTTLGSGNIINNVDEYNVNSLNNIINRLPGGLSYAYSIDGSPIQLTSSGNINLNSDINLKLIFTNDIYNTNNIDDTFNTLDTDFTVYKNAKGFQDGKIIIDNKDFKVYFNDNISAINKYAGAACLVLDDNGEIMLLVLGYLDMEYSMTNQLKLSYGDLFKISGLPTTIQQY